MKQSGAGASAVQELGELLAVTGDEPEALLRLIDLCDRVIAMREISSATTADDRNRHGVT